MPKKRPEHLFPSNVILTTSSDAEDSNKRRVALQALGVGRMRGREVNWCTDPELRGGLGDEPCMRSASSLRNGEVSRCSMKPETGLTCKSMVFHCLT